MRTDEELKMVDTDLINDEEVAIYKFHEQPKWVGHWIINPQFKVSATKKPSAIHRYFTKLLLGWEWSDDKL
jgi:hypothetical protein